MLASFMPDYDPFAIAADPRFHSSVLWALYITDDYETVQSMALTGAH